MAATWDLEEARLVTTAISIYRVQTSRTASATFCGEVSTVPKTIVSSKGLRVLNIKAQGQARALSGIFDLCYEILLHILRFVSWAPPTRKASRLTFLDVQLVCKHWHQVIRSDPLLLDSKIDIRGKYSSGMIHHPSWSGISMDAPIDLNIKDILEDGTVPEGKSSLYECGMRRLSGSIDSRRNQMRSIDCQFYMENTGSQLVSSLCDTKKRTSFPRLTQLALRYLPRIDSNNYYSEHLDPFVICNRVHEMTTEHTPQSSHMSSLMHGIQSRLPLLATLMLSNMLPSFQDMDLFMLALHSPKLVNLVLDKVHPTIPTSAKLPIVLANVKRLWLSPVDGIITHIFKDTISCPNVEVLYIIDAPPPAFASLLLNTTGLFPRVRELHLAMLHPHQPLILWPLSKWLYQMPNIEDVKLDGVPSEMLDMLLLPAPAPENPHCPDYFAPEGARLMPQLRQVQVRNTILTPLSKQVFECF